MAELGPEDRAAIVTLKSRYFRLVDGKDWVRLRSLFADGCRFEGLWSAAESPDAFIANLRANLGPEVITVHRGYAPELEARGAARARGIWPMTDYLSWPLDRPRAYLGVGLQGQTGIRGYGYYEEDYLLADGVWRIAYMRLSRQRIDPILGEQPTAVFPLASPDPGWL